MNANYKLTVAVNPAMSSKYNVASLFAGIGGICLGFKEAGANIVWANEIDKYACETYRENFDGAAYLDEGDIYQKSVPEGTKIDIVAAGFPCQAFSIAGYRKGFEDDRGVLYTQVLRIIQENQPKAVFLENVKNLKSHDNGNTYRVIRESLESEGYEVTEAVLNTMKYGNIPQNRERIYVAAFRKNASGESAMKYFSFPEEIDLTRTIHDVVKEDVKQDPEFYYKSEHQYYSRLNEAMTNRDTVYQWRRTYVRENKRGVCPTLTANMGGGGHNVPIIRDDFGIRKLTPEECLRFQGFPEEYHFPKMANSHKYKQAGNSVSVPVIKRIAENIIKALDEDADVL